MADITKCANKTCPLNKKCYRFTAPSNSFRQSYCDFKVDIIEGVPSCDHFWDNEGYEKLKTDKK